VRGQVQIASTEFELVKTVRAVHFMPTALSLNFKRDSTMKLLLLILPLLSLTLHAEPTMHHPADWELGTLFPDQPVTSEKETTTPQGHKIVEARAAVEQNGELYLAECVVLPGAPFGQQRDISYNAGFQAMQRANLRTLKSEEKILICGHDGRRYVLETKDGMRVTDHRVVFVGNKLFVFAYERPASAATPAAADTFFAKITEKIPTTKPVKTPDRKN
jgi:hypothetical protein